MELTILMPCLNEEETLAICINKAKTFLIDNDIDGEILIADNGSTDSSKDIAIDNGARVINVDRKGYGSALIAGCNAAKGKYVIMGDADDSYDFTNLMPFVEKLREGYDLVMGNRFKGGIEPGAMPSLHKYIGNPILSFIGRLLYSSKIGDFHCGLRGYNKESIQKLNLHTTGMEYASEMVVSAEIANLKIIEVPTTLSKDGRSRPPHLRSWSDGWRHLKFLFMYTPTWLFLLPGILFTVVGLIINILLFDTDRQIFNINFSIQTLLYGSAFIIMGINIILLFFIMRIYAENNITVYMLNPKWTKKLNENYIIFIGAVLFILGIICSILAMYIWKRANYGDLFPMYSMRFVIPAITGISTGIMMTLSGFIIGLFKLNKREN